MHGTETYLTCGDLTLSLIKNQSKINLRSVRSQLSYSTQHFLKNSRKCGGRAHSMQNLNPDYIVGLVDGEGSFTVYVRDPEKPSANRRVTVEPKFYIKLIERDKEILDSLQKFFGCGTVYFQKDNRPNHQYCYRYEVFNREELFQKIIPFFKKHLPKFPSKKLDFLIFCQIMEMIKRKEHLTESGLRELFKLKQRMH